MKKIILFILLLPAVCFGQYEVYTSLQGWDDIRIAGSEFGFGATAPSLRDFNSGNIKVIGMAGGSQNDVVYFQVQMPHNYDGTEIHPHLHLCTETTEDVNDTVVFLLEYQWAEIDSVFSTSSKDTLITSLTGFTAWKQILKEFKEINKTTYGVSQMMVCSLTRLQDHAKDNYSGYVIVLEFDIHYRRNNNGSKNELTR